MFKILTILHRSDGRFVQESFLMGRNDVVANWRNFWSRHQDLIHRERISSPIFFEFKKLVHGFQGKRVLEGGSGIGEISIDIANEKGSVFLLDTSNEALHLSKDFFSQWDQEAQFVQASIFQIPFTNNSFDVVWNAGVVEHFMFHDQFCILKEFSRVCKPGGYVVMFNPYARGWLYRLGKFVAEKRGIWEFGEEYPVASLKEQIKLTDLALEKELPVCFPLQITFLRYLGSPFFYMTKALYWLTGGKYNPLWEGIFGGYLLATIARKPLDKKTSLEVSI